ncbi:MAG: inositol monophosphatase [Oligoflexales bacterium]
MELKFLEELLHDTSKLLKDSFGGRYKVQVKKDHTLVTDVDLKSDRFVRNVLGKNFPDDEIMTEEADFLSDREEGRGVWIVDPLDGTSNFAHGYPFFCVSIAKGFFDSRGHIHVLFGGVANPLSGEIFIGARGQGAFLGDERLSVRSEPLESNLFCAMSDFEGEGLDAMKAGWSFRKDGAIALDLALVSRGTFDGFWGRSLKPWDIAAGALLISEAGGVVRSMEVEETFHIECGSLLCGAPQGVGEISQYFGLT